jgi:hypothetical protein
MQEVSMEEKTKEEKLEAATRGRVKEGIGYKKGYE